MRRRVAGAVVLLLAAAASSTVVPSADVAALDDGCSPTAHPVSAHPDRTRTVERVIRSGEARLADYRSALLRTSCPPAEDAVPG